MKTKQNVLFLCNHNSARSQIAEALLAAKNDPRFEVFSAGLEPRPIAEGAVSVMNEVGLDIGSKRSKSIREFMGKEVVHHAIFLCSRSEDDCPKIYPFANHSHKWRIPAPGDLARTCGSEKQAFREVRDLIDQNIDEWLAELALGAA